MSTGPDRAKHFSNNADSYLKVHHLGARYADVTERAGGIWERLQYDWSESNQGKNLRGRVLSGVVGTIGKRSLGKAFTNSVKAIEARGDDRGSEVS